VQAEVRHGSITLRGSVEHHYQRTEAEQAVRYLAGVKGVFNEITVKSSIKPQAIEQKISAAFQRNARLDARQITVTATDGTAHSRASASTSRPSSPTTKAPSWSSSTSRPSGLTAI